MTQPPKGTGGVLPPMRLPKRGQIRARGEGKRGLTVDDAAPPDAWQGLLDSLTDTVAVLDRSGFIVAVNRAWTLRRS